MTRPGEVRASGLEKEAPTIEMQPIIATMLDAFLRGPCVQCSACNQRFTVPAEDQPMGEMFANMAQKLHDGDTVSFRVQHDCLSEAARGSKEILVSISAPQDEQTGQRRLAHVARPMAQVLATNIEGALQAQFCEHCNEQFQIPPEQLEVIIDGLLVTEPRMDFNAPIRHTCQGETVSRDVLAFLQRTLEGSVSVRTMDVGDVATIMNITRMSLVKLGGAATTLGKIEDLITRTGSKDVAELLKRLEGLSSQLTVVPGGMQQGARAYAKQQNPDPSQGQHMVPFEGVARTAICRMAGIPDEFQQQLILILQQVFNVVLGTGADRVTVMQFLASRGINIRQDSPLAQNGSQKSPRK